jgi:predicted RecA/RadA family phage recombinase
MKNFIAYGESLQLQAPVSGVIGGQLYATGKLVGVVVADAAEGETFILKITGAYSDCPKITGEAWTTGDMIYYKSDGTGLTTTAAGNIYAGYAYSNALATDVTGSILLQH